MIVADTNLIGYLFLDNAQSPLAEKVLQLDSDWAAPLLWRSELRNVLTLYMRKEMLTFEEVAEIMDAAEELLSDNEYEVVSRDVLKLAKQSDSSAYDCDFVALATDLNVQLVTADKALRRNFPKIAMSPSEFIALMEGQ